MELTLRKQKSNHDVEETTTFVSTTSSALTIVPSQTFSPSSSAALTQFLKVAPSTGPSLSFPFGRNDLNNRFITNPSDPSGPKVIRYPRGSSRYPKGAHGTLNFAYSWQNFIFVVVVWQNFIFVVVDSRTTNPYGFVLSNTETKLFQLPNAPNIYLTTSGDVRTYKEVMQYVIDQINLAILDEVTITVQWVAQRIRFRQTENLACFLVLGWNPQGVVPVMICVETSEGKYEVSNPLKAGSAANFMGNFVLSTGTAHQLGTVLNEVFSFCIRPAVFDNESGGILRGYIIDRETGMDLWYSNFLN